MEKSSETVITENSLYKAKLARIISYIAVIVVAVWTISFSVFTLYAKDAVHDKTTEEWNAFKEDWRNKKIADSLFQNETRKFFKKINRELGIKED